MSSLPDDNKDILREALGIAWDSDRDREVDREAVELLFAKRPVVEERCQRARDRFHRHVEKHGSASWRDVRGHTIEDDLYSDQFGQEDLDFEEIHGLIEDYIEQRETFEIELTNSERKEVRIAVFDALRQRKAAEDQTAVVLLQNILEKTREEGDHEYL